MGVPVLSVSDGPQTTTADLVAQPLVIPARVLSLLADGNAFLSSTILRNGGRNASSILRFEESTPLYLDDDLEDVAEFDEIPVGAGQRGLPRIAVAIKKGRGIRISKEMVDENDLADVNRQVTQLANTLVRADERALRAALSNPAIPTIPAGAAWTSSSARQRDDILNALEVIGSAAPAATQGDDVFGFIGDTIVMNSGVTNLLGKSDTFNAVYRGGGPTSEDVAYTGKLPNQIVGLDPLQTRSWPTDRVLVCERGTVGVYSDTRPMQITGMYPEGNGPNGGPTESWRSDATRKRAVGVDQPLAACWITGIR